MIQRNLKTMSKREIEKALLVKADTYPMRTTCAECGCLWMEHFGELCPARDPGYYERSLDVLQGKLPLGAIAFIPRGTLFLPLIDSGISLGDLCLQ